MTRIAVFGATGRMGQTLIRLIADDESLELVGAATEPAHNAIGSDAGTAAGISALGVVITDDAAVAVAKADVAIDFTLPAAAMSNIDACVEQGVALVIGTTGLSAQDIDLIRDASSEIAIMQAANTSVGVNLCVSLLDLAARTLGDQVDIEIIEAHHRHKVDAPSGTALLLGQSVANALDRDLGNEAVFCREGNTGERKAGTIGFSTIRGGDIAGEHTVMFIGESERIEITHRATDRKIFAQGAVRAANWLSQHDAGLFNMQDVLGLR